MDAVEAARRSRSIAYRRFDRIAKRLQGTVVRSSNRAQLAVDIEDIRALRDSINAFLENERMIVESQFDEEALDTLDQWSERFDRECMIIEEREAQLEEAVERSSLASEIGSADKARSVVDWVTKQQNVRSLTNLFENHRQMAAMDSPQSLSEGKGFLPKQMQQMNGSMGNQQLLHPQQPDTTHTSQQHDLPTSHTTRHLISHQPHVELTTSQSDSMHGSHFPATSTQVHIQSNNTASPPSHHTIHPELQQADTLMNAQSRTTPHTQPLIHSTHMVNTNHQHPNTSTTNGCNPTVADVRGNGINNPTNRFEEAVTAAAIQAARAAVLAQSNIAAPSANSNHFQQSAAPCVRLPHLKIPQFSGSVLEWPEFWSLFTSTVHEHPTLSIVSKFVYLNDSLKGEARDAIAGIALTESNYHLAVETLKTKFGQPQLIIGGLYARLQQLPEAGHNFESIKSTFDSIDKILRQLSTLGEDVDSQRLLIHQILAKFPLAVTTKLEETRFSLNTPWTVSLLRTALRQFVDIRTNALRTAQVQSGQLPTILVQQTQGQEVKQTSTLTTNSDAGTSLVANGHPHGNVRPGTQPPAATQVMNKYTEPTYFKLSPCAFCGGDHKHNDCQTYRTTVTRKQRLTAQGRCYLCLQLNHRVPQCPQRTWHKCNGCHRQGHHHWTVCPERDEGHGPQPSKVNTLLSITEAVQLPSANVSFHSPGKPKVTAHLLLDSGSHRSYVTRRLAQHLQLEVLRTEELALSTFASNAVKTINSEVVCLPLPLLGDRILNVTANIIDDEITNAITREPLTSTDRSFLQEQMNGSPLADAELMASSNTSLVVDILIGSDYFWHVVTGHRLQLPSGLFTISSELGMVVSGKGSHKNGTSEITAMTAVTAMTATAQTYQDVDTMWKLDVIGIVDNPTISDDDLALQRFNSTVQIIDGRYQVTLPWKDNNSNLPSNYGLAMGRMKTLSRRLESSPELLHQYDTVIQHQLNTGIIEDAPVQTSALTHHLPHHPVITPTKATTKVRVVYDGSAKSTQKEMSLNECLFRGPVLLPHICALMMRFRIYPIVLLADIEKAFLQILIHPEDRDVLRFFWYKDPTRPLTPDNVRILRFCRVPFGLISSPFLLAATIEYHLKAAASDTALAILKNIYVDNVVLGCNSVEEAMLLYHESRKLFSEANMNLREWVSSSSEVNERLPEQPQNLSGSQSMLGLKWKVAADTLSIVGPKPDDSPVTKRTVLQTVAAVYDPLGLVSPITIQGKIFVQRLWMEGHNWDKLLPDELLREWNVILQSLLTVSEINIPRLVGSSGDNGLYSLVVFSDASAKCYATAVYLRLSTPAGTTCRLVFSKTRLAPKETRAKGETPKTVSLPRLELLGVLIGARALKYVKAQLGIPITASCIWTDSACVLYWLKTSKPLPRFVANRVDEIKTADASFRYVHTSENPADIPSRGCSADELAHNTLWWNGPQWLLLDPSEWPTWNVPSLPALAASDTTVATATEAAAAPAYSELEGGANCSSLRKLLRVTTLCIKFLKKQVWDRLSTATKAAVASRHVWFSNLFERMSDRPSATAMDLRLANVMWVRSIQATTYRCTLLDIANNKRNTLQNQLGLVVDINGILRCQGRLIHASKGIDNLPPALLPRRHWFTKLVILHHHERLLHAGAAHTLTQLRATVWIPQGRQEVQVVLKQCRVCRRHEGPAFALPTMPPFPKERVIRSAPFTYVGIDYFGPVQVKDEPSKVWVCLFTCLAVRAVHLEVIPSLSTASFIDCFTRFAARRGVPELLLSDNASQFRLAATTFDIGWREVLKDESLQQYLSSRQVQWRFTTECAPWQGGVYERLIVLADWRGWLPPPLTSDGARS
ncbi:uncharacterized protein LOC135812837 [Sycon ciliatum]|uniref:uncharacterized protein LOC135812837 n=1 Tax=Sycon ciliatum TaxID=27933 RepID=UPI0031F6B54F